MVNILLGMRADPLIGGACDRVYEPVEEDRARAILAFHGFEEGRDNQWVKKSNGAVLYRARIKKAQVVTPLLQFPN